VGKTFAVGGQAMRISSIPQIYRNVNRWREILSVLSKYELANWLGRLGPEFAKDLFKAPGGTSIARHRWETRIRLAAVELGPTFIKLGQMLSTRPDLIGVTLADELQHLQANVHPDAPETVRETVESELGRPIEELFDEFDDAALASASIGQVHAARLKTGEPVVVKVQHAGIEPKVAVDTEILNGLAQLAERMPEFENYRPRAIAEEFQRMIHRELDFTRERRNMEQFASDFAGDPTIHIPHAYRELSTRRVLTMERIEGIKLSEAERLKSAGLDLEEVARRGARAYMEMIFSNSFYHADPHPGNVLLLDDNVIGLLDFGMVSRIDEQLHENMGEMLLALANFDAEHLTSIIIRIGAVHGDLDRAALSVDVTDFVSHYASRSMDDLDLGGALNEMIEIIRRYGIMLPARLALLLKTLISLEGTGKLLSPRFSLLEIMKPYRRKILQRRLSPRRKLRKMRRFYAEVEHLIGVLPQGIVDILDQVQSGKFDVHLDHRGLEPSVNRLVLGMLASALFVGSSLMLSLDVQPTVGDFPLTGWFPLTLIQEVSVPGMVGITFSVLLGLRLWRAINKSGHLDRRQ
jgi:ubiquinone biosynthesis protein